MKRIILIAIVSLMSHVSLFAASITWGTDASINDPAGSPISNGTAFLYMYQEVGGFVPTFTNGAWNTSGAQLIASLTLPSLQYDGTPVPGMVAATSSVAYETDYKTEGYKYVMIITTGNATDLGDITAGYYLVSDSIDLTHGGYPVGQPENSSGYVLFTQDQLSGWQKIVPEPTALTLLALGVAGVALRRRIR